MVFPPNCIDSLLSSPLQLTESSPEKKNHQTKPYIIIIVMIKLDLAKQETVIKIYTSLLYNFKVLVIKILLCNYFKDF